MMKYMWTKTKQRKGLLDHRNRKANGRVQRTVYELSENTRLLFKEGQGDVSRLMLGVSQGGCLPWC